jgi:hypothetical protein
MMSAIFDFLVAYTMHIWAIGILLWFLVWRRKRMKSKGVKLFPGAFVLDALTEKQLHHLFLALALHTKTTREEQADWVKTRFKIWGSSLILR